MTEGISKDDFDETVKAVSDVVSRFCPGLSLQTVEWTHHPLDPLQTSMICEVRLRRGVPVSYRGVAPQIGRDGRGEEAHAGRHVVHWGMAAGFLRRRDASAPVAAPGERAQETEQALCRPGGDLSILKATVGVKALFDPSAGSPENLLTDL